MGGAAARARTATTGRHCTRATPWEAITATRQRQTRCASTRRWRCTSTAKLNPILMRSCCTRWSGTTTCTRDTTVWTPRSRAWCARLRDRNKQSQLSRPELVFTISEPSPTSALNWFRLRSPVLQLINLFDHSHFLMCVADIMCGRHYCDVLPMCLFVIYACLFMCVCVLCMCLLHACVKY